MCKILLDIKSTKFPNIPLFHLVDRIWERMRYRGEYTFLFILYLAEEAKIMMYNLILYMCYKYRNEVLRFFIEEELEAA